MSFWAVTPRGSPKVPRLSAASTTPSFARRQTNSVNGAPPSRPAARTSGSIGEADARRRYWSLLLSRRRFDLHDDPDRLLKGDRPEAPLLLRPAMKCTMPSVRRCSALGARLRLEVGHRVRPSSCRPRITRAAAAGGAQLPAAGARSLSPQPRSLKPRASGQSPGRWRTRRLARSGPARLRLSQEAPDGVGAADGTRPEAQQDAEEPAD